MTEQPVLDVVDISTLEYSTARDQCDEFAGRWGCPPKAVAIPMLSPAGIPFTSKYANSVGVRYGGESNRSYLGRVVEEFAKLGLDIFLTITPSLPFVRSPALHIVDISGDASAQACVSKEATRRLLLDLAEIAIPNVQEACAKANQRSGKASRLVGVALDIVNLWPMGGNNERIELTCFCRECREQLEAMSVLGRDLVRSFERFPNPWNLMLQAKRTGIRPINDFDYDINQAALLDLSHFRGFDEILKNNNADLEKEAGLLLDYVKTRHRQVVAVMKDLFERLNKLAGTDPLKRVIIASGGSYDWTEGVFLSKLDDSAVCDELWVDPSPSGFVTERVASRAYMQRASRYHLDAFFDLLVAAQDVEKRTVVGLARYPEKKVRQILEHRRRKATAVRLDTELDLYCLTPITEDGERGRIGFVGPNLSERLGQLLVQNARIVPSSEEEDVESEKMSLLQQLLESG